MQTPERVHVMDWVWPVAIFCLALGTRSWYLLELTDSAKSAGPLRVQDDRAEDITQEVASLQEDKDFFSQAPWSSKPERTAYEASGYVFFVFALNKLPG